MLHIGKGRGAFHRNRKPQGGTPTPAPAPVGNLVLATTWADFLSKYAAANASGDVISINHGGYTPSGAVETLDINRSMTSLTLIGNDAQLVRVISGTLNCNTELVHWTFAGDAYWGGAINGSYSARYQNASKITHSGCTYLKSVVNFMMINCQDIYDRNSVNVRSREDHYNAWDSSARIRIDNSYTRDHLHVERLWAWANGTAPSMGGLQPGGWNPANGDFTVDGDHGDYLQTATLITGTPSDVQVNSADHDGWTQGFQIADSDGDEVRYAIQNSTLTIGLTNGINADRVSNFTLINNNIQLRADHDPLFSVTTISTLPGTGQSGTLRGGQNNFGSTPNINVGASSVNYLSGTVNGTATLPTDPTFMGTTSNVGNLPTLRARPSYTPYAGPPVFDTDPIIRVPSNAGSSPYTLGTYFTVNCAQALGFVGSLYGSVQTEWFVNAVSQGVGTGLAAMVFQGNVAGSVLTCRQRTGSGNPWTNLSNSITMAGGGGGGATWDPANKSANVTLTSANTIATDITGAATNSAAFSTTAKSADGSYEVILTPTTWNGGSQGVGLARAGTSTSSEIGSAAATWGMYNSGLIQKAGAFAGNVGSRTSTAYRHCLRISGGGTVATLWIYDVTGAAWLSSFGGGDPNGGGGGWDVSYILGGSGIQFAWNGNGGANASVTCQSTCFTPTSGFTVWG